MLGKWIAAYIDYGEDGVRSSEVHNMPAATKKPPKNPNAKGYIASELPVPVQNELRYLRMENVYLKN